MQYAVMGNPIEHSLSPLIHQLFAKQCGLVLEYGKILIDVDRFAYQVQDFFQQGGRGLNITAPCKQQAFALSDKMTARCAKAGAANTLWKHEGQLMADNTDGVGFLADLSRYLNVRNKLVLILGAGGAVRGILQPLLEANPRQITIANRTHATAIALQAAFQESDKIEVAAFDMLDKPYDLIVHALPVGAEEVHLLPQVVFQSSSLGYDLTYHRHGITPFVSYVRGQGAMAVDGLGMLICQAAEAFRIWHGILPDVTGVSDLVRNTS